MLFQKILLKLKKKGRGLAPILETIFNTEIWYLATGSHLNLSLKCYFWSEVFLHDWYYYLFSSDSYRVVFIFYIMFQLISISLFALLNPFVYEKC